MKVLLLIAGTLVAYFVSVGSLKSFALPIQFVDQSQNTGTGSNNSGGGGLSSRKGQTFTPTFAGLDVVEMRFTGITSGDSFLVNIRDTDAPGLTGTIIGTSETVSFPTTSFSDVVGHYDFASVVPLTPGHQYAIELVPVTLGGSGFSMRINTSDVYGGGGYYSSPTFLQTADARFSVGLHQALPIIPEPSTLTLFGLGLLVFQKRRRKARNL